MLHLIPLFALLAVSSALYIPEVNFLTDNSTFDERIIGGNEVRKNSYPFMVRLEGTKRDGGEYLCGGTLVHENYVITAAHCVHDSHTPVRSIRLHFGDHHLWKEDDTQTTMSIPLSSIQHHSQYDDLTLDNDIALIKLPRKAPISAHVKPICVASAATVKKFQSGTAIGWGLTRNPLHGGQVSEVLKEVNLPMLPDRACLLLGAINPQIMMCAGNTQGIQASICAGDSGGPYVVKPGQYALTGVSSFTSMDGCVAIGVGVVFVRVSGFIPWLQNLMGSALCVV